MFGTIVNNAQLIDLVREGTIEISGFRSQSISFIHYPLRARSLLEICERGESVSPQTRVIANQEDQLYRLNRMSIFFARLMSS